MYAAILHMAKRAIFAQRKLTSTPMPDDLGQPKLGKHGGKRIKGQQGGNVTLRSRENSRDYILARLEREGLTEWVEAILTRKLTVLRLMTSSYLSRLPDRALGVTMLRLIEAFKGGGVDIPDRGSCFGPGLNSPVHRVHAKGVRPPDGVDEP